MFQRLVVALDQTPASAVGISFATALARQNSASVHVVFVNQFLLAGRGHTVLSDGDAAQVVRQAVAELQSDGIEASGSVVRTTCFEVGPAVVAEAKTRAADAIIVGSQRRRRLARLGGHGVREQITQMTELPVLTAPAPLKVWQRVPSEHISG